MAGGIMIAIATLAGAWLARRPVGGRAVTLGSAGGMLMVIAGLHLLPDAWSGARQAGLPAWVVPSAALVSFVVAGAVVGRGCACRADREAAGGAGAAAALAGHRLLEGAALTVVASIPVTVALLAHALAEGIGAGTLLDSGSRRRRAAWLTLMCAAPVAGSALARILAVPGSARPVLLAVAAGVLAQAARVSLRAARPRTSSVVAALIAAAVTMIVVHAAG
jgi:ZIP family zinc transporter